MPLSMVMRQWFQNQLDMLSNFHPISKFFLLFVCPFFLLWCSRVWETKYIKCLPSPPKLPIIGHLHLLGALPHKSLRVLSEKYGPLMLLHMGSCPVLVVSSAKMGKEIMKTHDINFSNRPVTKAAKAFLYGGLDVGFAPYGEYWREIRKICVVDLLSVKRVQSYKYIREEEITRMVGKINKSCSAKRDINLSDVIISTTNNVTSRIMLGRSLEAGEGKSEYADLAKEVNDLFGVFSVEDMFPSLGWVDVVTGLMKRMKKASKAMHHFLDEIIEEHLKSTKEGDYADRKDFVDLLLEAEKDPTLRIEFTRKNIRANIVDMFVAGTDTTYTSIEWAMAELINHPRVMKKLQQEIRRVVGTKDKVDENEINQMEYFNCVIKETLRLHPPAVLSIPRVSTESTNIEGYEIPAKTRVLINLWAISRDPKVWDRPDEFIPERFIDNPIDFRGNDFEFIPFGSGRRICPGISFTVQTVGPILANLLCWFDWELVGNANKRDISETFGLSCRLKSPLHLVPISHFLDV